MFSILWRRLNQPGHEAARLYRRHDRWLLAGTAVFVYEDQACSLEYTIVCDSAWRTVSGEVRGWIGSRPIDVTVMVEQQQRWRLNGADCPLVAGCSDLDLNFSPSTNLLPIRRLDPAIGQAVDVRAAWLRFPSFKLEPLEQRYTRLDDTTVSYESDGGRFRAELQVNKAGLVIDYPTFCRAEGVFEHAD